MFSKEDVISPEDEGSFIEKVFFKQLVILPEFTFNCKSKKNYVKVAGENTFFKELLIIIFDISTCISEKVYICRLEF